MNEYFNMEEKVKAITVEDIKATANKYFSGNYMTISFSEGDPKIQLFDKAQIDPLQMPDEEYSQYYKDFVKRPVQAPTPKFTDFSDIQSKDLFKGGKMFYVKNPKNDIFFSEKAKPNMEKAVTLITERIVKISGVLFVLSFRTIQEG